MPNFCMTLSYDGTRYNGWQRQGNTPDTIQGCRYRLSHHNYFSWTAGKS